MRGDHGARVLVVEDNASLAAGLSRALETEGYGVEHIARGDRAIGRLEDHDFDLIILDLMLPGASGFDVLRRLREGRDDTPVLILSARGEDVDKIQGFRLGADDYVVKPVGLLELLFRTEAILRRSHGTGRGAPGTYRFGNVVVDEGARTVERAGARVGLARLEFDLLVTLLRAGGHAVSRERLLRDVWDISNPGRIRTRTIDTHVAALRAKLEAEPAQPRHILTVRKVGYRLAGAERVGTPPA